MTARGKIPSSVLFIGATGLGLSSTLQAYWLQRLAADAMPIPTIPRTLALNLVYWYVPALVAPVIVALATRYQVGRVRWPMLALVHTGGALGYAAFHTLVMLATRFIL